MRAANRVATILLGLVLLAGGLLVAVDAMLVAAGRPDLSPMDGWRGAPGGPSLSDRRVLAVCVAVAVAGLVVLVLQLRPWAPQRLSTRDPAWWLSRRSVQRRVGAAVATLPGVHRVRAAVRGRRRSWRLRVEVRAAAGYVPAGELPAPAGVVPAPAADQPGPTDRREAVLRVARAELDRLTAPPDVAVAVVLRRPPRPRRGRVPGRMPRGRPVPRRVA